MPVAIPNSADATYPPQAQPDAMDWYHLSVAASLTGVVSGGAVTTSSGTTVAVASCSYRIAGTLYSYAGGTASCAADGTNPRFYLITLNTSQAVTAEAGSAAAAPAFPDVAGAYAVPPTKIILAAVYVPAGAVSLASTNIKDRRQFLASTYPASPGVGPMVSLSTYANNTATADASAGIVNAINAFTDFVGGTILVDGRFRIDSTVNLPATRPIIFQGLAGTSYTSFNDTTGGAFRSQFETGTAGMTMFQFDANPSTTPNHYQRIFKNIRFVDRASIRTSTLFRLDQITRWRFEDCWFVNANKGIVLDTSFFDGLTNGDNAWAEFYNCKLHHNVVGLETVNCNGFRWYGGDILCAYVTTTDHVGMNLMDVQHVRIHGLRIDGANDAGVARGIGIDIVGKGCSITDINTEKLKIAVRVGKEQYGNETSGEEQYSKVHIINPTATGVSTGDGSTQYVFDTWARHSSLQNHKVVSAQAAYSMVRSDNWILGPLSANDPGMRLPNLSSNPASGVAGEIVVVNGVLKIHNGTSWVSVGSQT